MINFIKVLFFSNTAKDSIISFVGVFVSAVLGFFLTYLLSGNLTPSQFGIFVTALTFSLLMADLLDLGINSSVLNFTASADEEKKKIFIKSTLLIRITIITIVGIVLLFFGHQISLLIFSNENIIPLIQMSSLGIAFTMLVTWGQAVFQAEKNFLLSSILGSSVNLLRFGVVGLLIITGFFSYLNAYFFLQLIIFIPMLFVFLKLGLSFIREKTTLLHYKQILKFGIPVGLSYSVFSISSRLDQILVLKMLGENEAGFYGLAFRLASSLFFFAASFSSVITPRYISISPKDFLLYFKKTILVSVSVASLVALMIPIIPFIFPFLFKNTYGPSLQPLQILTIGMIFFILSIPFSYSILYRYKKPLFALILSVINLLILWFLLNYLIPVYGINGAASSITLGYFINLIVTFAYFAYLFRRYKGFDK